MRQFALQVRYNDLDPNRHVNNGAYITYLETSRVTFSNTPFQLPGMPTPATLDEVAGAECSKLVTFQHIEYKESLEFRIEPVTVSLWITHVGRTSYTFDCEILEEDRSAVYAIARTGMVLASRATGRPESLPDPYREYLQSHRGEPLTFRAFGD